MNDPWREVVACLDRAIASRVTPGASLAVSWREGDVWRHHVEARGRLAWDAPTTAPPAPSTNSPRPPSPLPPGPPPAPPPPDPSALPPPSSTTPPFPAAPRLARGPLTTFPPPRSLLPISDPRNLRRTPHPSFSLNKTQ